MVDLYSLQMILACGLKNSEGLLELPIAQKMVSMPVRLKKLMFLPAIGQTLSSEVLATV
jgi:hypothetical protein